jgi:phosphoribosylaminoimidazole-succinocarboxamide synthase
MRPPHRRPVNREVRIGAGARALPSWLVVSLTHVASGKVREIYAIDDRHLLLVATDRISAYDCTLEPPIPDKGRVLTGLSAFWFDRLDIPNHFVTTDLAGLNLPADDREWMAARSMLVRKASVIPLECVVRGYLYGSAWDEYSGGGGPTTEHLPPGLEMGSHLTDPVFTPARKAATGHDENLDEATARTLVGDDIFDILRTRSIEAYRRASEHSTGRGIILADTKFEFGLVDDGVILIDEVLTPDSSRYWPAAEWATGRSMPSFDKQYVRNWLDSVGFDRTPPAPVLPDEVVIGTRARYVEAYERLTGTGFEQYLEENNA